MIGIESLGIYIPVGRIDNRQRMGQFDVDESFLSNKTGMLRLAVKSENEETSDMCCRAFNALRMKTGMRPEELECIVVCTQNPDAHGLPISPDRTPGHHGGRMPAHGEQGKAEGLDESDTMHDQGNPLPAGSRDCCRMPVRAVQLQAMESRLRSPV